MSLEILQYLSGTLSVFCMLR